MIDEYEMPLRVPITFAKKLYESIHLEEPTAKQIADAYRGAEVNADVMIKLVSLVSSLPLGVIEQMRKRDIEEAESFLDSFSFVSPTTPTSNLPSSQSSTAGDQTTHGS